MKVYFNKSQNKYYKVTGFHFLGGLQIPIIKECSKRFYYLGLQTGVCELYKQFLYGKGDKNGFLNKSFMLNQRHANNKTFLTFKL